MKLSFSRYICLHSVRKHFECGLEKEVHIVTKYLFGVTIATIAERGPPEAMGRMFSLVTIVII